jgi:hypothetical protein
VTYLLPVVAVVLGSLVLDEALTVAMVGGTAVILAAWRSRRQAAGLANGSNGGSPQRASTPVTRGQGLVTTYQHTSLVGA